MGPGQGQSWVSRWRSCGASTNWVLRTSVDQILTKPNSGTWEGLCGSHGLEGQGYGTSECGVTDCRTDPPWLLMKMGAAGHMGREAVKPD